MRPIRRTENECPASAGDLIKKLPLRQFNKTTYWTCSIEPRSLQITLLTLLEGVWF
jgi:hypothetical protein